MNALRFGLKRSRSNVWVVQKRFGEGSWVPADMPIIKQKWRSVDVVGKITGTMRNIAAGKLPSCEKFLSITRPFASVCGPLMHVTNSPPGIQKRLHLVVGCERGLCGVVGANIPKLLQKTMKALEANGEMQNEVVVLGKKTTSKVKAQQGDKVTEGFIGSKTKMPTFGMCLDVVDKLKGREYDELILYYNVFKNMQVFELDTIKTYNLKYSQQIADVQFPLYDVEGDERTIMQNLQEFKLATTMYNCMAEQLASEMGSRLASMDSAAKTCKEKSKEYESIYQRLRKTKITNELTVLSVGAKLAKKK